MPELICDRCKQNYPVWFTENDLWNKIAGRFNMLCPTCFCFLALVVDYKTTGWFLTVEERASKSSELAATDNQQLKQAIALIRECSNGLSFTFPKNDLESYLKFIEQHACV
jgi:hypothetical protein